MRIVHVLPTRSPTYGGPVRVAEQHACVAADHGHEVTILPETRAAELDLLGTRLYWPRLRGLRTLECAVYGADLVHVHGIWSILTSCACSHARRLRVPYLVTPHGMLTRWARSQKPLRKRLFMLIRERRLLDGASALHFLNESERLEALDLRLRPSTFTLPNGVQPVTAAGGSRLERIGRLLPALTGRTVILFVGRLHPKKGLDILVQAFALALGRNPDLHLVIAGPDEGPYTAALRRLAERCGADRAVTLTGAVYGSDKEELLRRADIFALSSREEGDSVAVKEAMAAGLPVVITTACRLPEVATHAAGIVVAPEVREVARALEVVGRDPSIRSRMGAAGRRLARDRFDATRLGVEMLEIYQDVLTARRTSPRWSRGPGAGCPDDSSDSLPPEGADRRAERDISARGSL